MHRRIKTRLKILLVLQEFTHFHFHVSHNKARWKIERGTPHAIHGPALRFIDLNRNRDFTQFRRRLAHGANKFAIFLLIVALLGFADATYLTIEHYQNKIPPCSVGGCEQVLTSAYSVVAGVPVSLMGSVYYLLVLIGMFAYLESKNLKILRN